MTTAARRDRRAEVTARPRDAYQMAVVTAAVAFPEVSWLYWRVVAAMLARKAAVCERLMCWAACFCWDARRAGRPAGCHREDG